LFFLPFIVCMVFKINLDAIMSVNGRMRKANIQAHCMRLLFCTGNVKEQIEYV